MRTISQLLGFGSALVFCASAPKVQACFCAHPPTFCASMDPAEHPADISILCVKIEQVYYGMRVKVLYDLAGQIPEGDTLTVWGIYNGGEGGCRYQTANWNVGDTLFGGFHDGDLLGNIFGIGYPPNLEQPGDYVTNECGTFYLGWSNGHVTGAIAPGVDSASLDEMAQYVNGCSTGLNVPLRNDSSMLFWDAASSELISSSTFAVQLMDVFGRAVQAPRIMERRMPITGLAPGTYLAIATSGERRQVLRFIVR